MKITKLFQKVNNQILEIDIPSIEELDKRYLKSSDASNTYLSKTDAISNYLSKSGGNITGVIYKRGSFTLGSDSVVAENTQFILQDSTGYVTGGMNAGIRDNGNVDTSLWANTKKSDESLVQSYLRAFAETDGTTYATCPNPRGLYNTDIVNYQSIVDYSVKRLINGQHIYVKPSTGSDIADLNSGRGLSPDKPFKTPEAAIKWATEYLSILYNIITIRLEENCTMGAFTLKTRDNGIVISGSNENIVLTLTGPISFAVGNLRLQNIKLAGEVPYFIESGSAYYGPSQLCIANNVSFDGTVTEGTLIASNGGIIVIQNRISGSVTGPRYKVVYGGCILTKGYGPNVIPGTEAGTCDESSTYF